MSSSSPVSSSSQRRLALATAVMRLAGEYADGALGELAALRAAGKIVMTATATATATANVAVAPCSAVAKAEPTVKSEGSCSKREATDDNTEWKEAEGSMPVDEQAPASPASADADAVEARILRARIDRIARVVDLVECSFTGVADSGNISTSAAALASGGRSSRLNSGGGSYGIDRRLRCGSTAAFMAISRLGDCLGAITGNAPRVHQGGAEAGASNTAASAALTRTTLVPASRPVGLPEVALLLYGGSIKTVFRRRQREPNAAGGGGGGVSVSGVSGVKRTRDSEGRGPASTQAASSSSCTAALSEEQRRRRFAVYSSHTALLPRLDTLDAALRAMSPPMQTRADDPTTGGSAVAASASDGNTVYIMSPRDVCHVSPAVRELAALNVSAERALLRHAWSVRTKAMLLARLPSLYETASRYRAELAGLSGTTTTTTIAATTTSSSSYFDVVCCDSGVVRVSVQHGLVVDLTYNLLERRWTLLQLHWSLWAPACAIAADEEELLSLGVVEQGGGDDSAGNNNATDTSSSSFCSPSVGFSELRCLVPNHGAAMRDHVQRHLAEGGVEAGLIAAGRLLCTVAMDVAAAQARGMSARLFALPQLRRAFHVDVRQGTHVSVVAGPPITTSGGEEGSSTSSRTVMLKFSVAAGTVVLETTWTGGGGGAGVAAASARSAAVSDKTVVRRVLAQAPGSPIRGVIMDLEQVLWRTVLER